MVTTSRVDFIAQKKKYWAHILQRIACLVQPHLVIVIWLQDILLTFEIAASYPSRSVVTYYMLPRTVQKALFEASLESHCRQLSSFENSVVKEWKYDLVLAFLKMARILTQRKRPYTELEFVVLRCIAITADLPRGGKKLLIKQDKFHYEAMQLNVHVFILQEICWNNFFTSCRTLSRFVFISTK